jgi:hypothetical protein
MSIGTILVTAFLSVITLGIMLVLVLRDWWTRADAISREGIVRRSGVLRWSDLEDVEVITRHGGRVGHLTSVSFVQLRFPGQTILVGPWGAPDPELVLRALSAGAGKRIDVPRPRGID